MVEELEQETQQDPIPKLPKGYVAIKKSGLPPLPAGYVEKKNLSVNGVGVGGTVGNSKAQSSAPTYTPNTDQSNPFSIGGQYNQPKKLDAEGLDLLNTKHDAAIAEQIKKYPLRKIPLTPILDNTALPKPISEIDANEAIARGKQHKIDMETAIDNTTLKVLKQKGIVAGKGSPYYEAERKKIEEKTKPTMIGGIVIKGAEATYHKDKDGNIGLDRNLGFLEGIRKGFNAAVDGEDEANAFAEMNTQQKVEYANKQMEGKPTEYMEERGGVGELLGGATPYLVKAAAAGTLATAAAIAAPETGGASLVGLAPTLTVLLTAPDMIKQGAKDEIMTRYMQLKQERPNIPDEELMKIAEQGEISGGIVGAAEALAFTTTLKLPILKDSKNVLTTYLKGVASSAIHLGGIMAGTKAAQLAERKLEGYNVDTDKAVDEIATTFTENATAGAILNGLISGAHTLPKVVKSAFKFSLKDTPISEIKTALDANVEAGRIPPEVAEQTIADIDGYKTALAKTSDGLTPETQASVAGLIQARDNVAAEMATKDPTQRAVYEQKIEAYNKQIEKITKTNNPLKYEIDEVTGNPIDKVAPELPDVTVPIEGTDKKGVPVGEDVPEPTDPSTPQVKSEGVVDKASNVGGDVVYHGSPIIGEKGDLTPSGGGELGAGVYFTRNEGLAKNYSKPRGEVKNMAEAESKSGVANLDLSGLKIKTVTKEEYLNKRNEFYDKEQELNNGEWDADVAKRAEEKLIKQYEKEGYDGLEVLDEQQGVIFPDSVKKAKHLNKKAVEQSLKETPKAEAPKAQPKAQAGSVGVGGDVKLEDNPIVVNMSLPFNEGVNTGLVKNSKGAVYHDRNSAKLEKLGYSKEQIDNLSQTELNEILAKNIENPNVATSAKLPIAEEQTTTQEFLNEASKEGGRFAELATALKKFFGIDGVETTIVKGLKDFFGGKADGDYGNKQIRIDEKAKNKLQTFLHEAIHKVTVDKLLQFERGDYSKLSKQDIDALQNLTRIFNESKIKIHEFLGGGKGDRTKGHYGFTNVHEFISEAFANPEFQHLLKNLPTEGKNPTIFKQFLDAVAKFLGLKDASILNDIFHHTESLREQSLKEQPTQKSDEGKVKPKVETTKTEENAIQPEIPTPKGEVKGEEVKVDDISGNIGGITHAANEVRRKDRGLPEYEKQPESFEQWNTEAENLIKNGYDVEALMNRIQYEKHDPTPVENAIRKIYYATIDAEITKNPTDKLLAIQKRLATVGDLANSRLGRSLVSLKGESSPLSSISDFYVAKMDALGKDVLTDAQKEEVKKQYEQVQKTNEEAALKIQKLEEENARLRAESELIKTKASTKKEKKDFVKEREDIKKSIIDKWNKSINVGFAADPSKDLLMDIAPDVAKLVKSYIQEGVVKLEEIVNKVHDELKGYIPDISKKNINDIIAGQYDKPKETKGDLLARLRGIKDKKSEEAVKILARIKSGDFSKQEKTVSWVENTELKKKFPKEYNEALDAIKAKEDARHEFDIALLRDQMARRTTGEKFTDNLSKAAGTVKAITTGIDDSAVAIQTYVSMLVRPRTGAKAFYQHIRQGLSQKKFDRWLSALHSSSDYKEMRDMGLDVTEPTSLKEREKEEIFNNRFNGTIKIKGKEYKLLDAPLKPFERAFTTLGNVTRVVGYRTISQKYKREGYTPEKDPELFKSLAKRLNTETGRGQVNEYVDMANKVVTMGIWSPKLMAQKFNILGISDLASLALSKSGTKGYYRQLHPKERAAAIRDVAQFATTVMALSYGFALANGGDVDDDPLSSTFMDVKLPNGKSYNFTGGFSGYIRAIAQFVAGKKHKDGKSINTGRLETAGRFFRGKTPPLTSAALNTASGKDFMGQPTTPLNELVNLAPISLRGITQQIQNDGTTSLFSQGIPTFFGFNVKNEKDYRTKSQLAGEEFSKANPDLKVFIDKGISLPEYDPKKISTKYTNGKSVSNLSEQKPKVQQDYITKHEANYKAELTKLKNGTYKVYKNADGGVHIKGNNTKEAGMTYTQFKDLTDDQIKYLEGQLTRRATVKTKKALKFELDDTEKIEEQ